ncbi:MAG: cysteine synthase [candidate division WOR-3 bacterium]
MNVKKSLLELIGKTPLVELSERFKGDIRTRIFLKLEFMNPGGSVKDRIGIKMIEEAERKGLIKEGATIIEPTSGNTGVGLAIVCAIKGYKMIFTMPDKVSKEKEMLLRAYGAEVIRCPTEVPPEDERSYYKVAERLAKEIENSFLPNQYANPFNPLAHYLTTGPEIWEDTDGKITHFVCGIGTGGTITGVAKFLKEKNPRIKVIGVDPEGSIYHELFYNTKGEIHQYKVEGIGEDFLPSTCDLSLIDEIIVVDDKTSFETARRLARIEGILAGGSSGSAVFASLKVAKELDENSIIVVILPDTGRNYLSKFYDDEWMKKEKFL